MHNHGGKKGYSMAWMMIPCLLLIVIALFSRGEGDLASSKYLWLIVVGVCVVPHIWMMFKGHGDHDGTDTEEKPDTTIEHKDNKHSSGCCH